MRTSQDFVRFFYLIQFVITIFENQLFYKILNEIIRRKNSHYNGC